jgi:hypothetical protein
MFLVSGYILLVALCCIVISCVEERICDQNVSEWLTTKASHILVTHASYWQVAESGRIVSV